MPKARVKQVQHRVLDAANIKVNSAGVASRLWTHPIFLDLGVNEPLAICWIQVAQLIPARPGPLWHHVDFSSVSFWTVAEIKSHAQPVGYARKWWHRVGRLIIRVKGLWLEVHQLGQLDGQQFVGHRMGHVMFVVNNRKRFAPISLTREQPVAQFVSDRRSAEIVLLKPSVY